MRCHEVVVARTQSTSAFCPENTSIGSEKNAPHQRSCERRKGPCEALSVAWRVDMDVSENSVPLNPMVNDHYPY